MRTDDLISLLAAGHRPVDTGWLTRATWTAAAGALAAAVVLVLVTLGPRPDLAGVWLSAAVLAKPVLGAAVAAIALTLFQRSLRPGLAVAPLLPLACLPFALTAAWGLSTLAQTAPAQWDALIFGRHWLACLIAVPLYSLAPLLVMLLVARRGAATRRRITGACAGLASAGLATVAYALHCPADGAPFLAIWYTLAIMAVAGLGALCFPRLLRW